MLRAHQPTSIATPLTAPPHPSAPLLLHCCFAVRDDRRMNKWTARSVDRTPFDFGKVGSGYAQALHWQVHLTCAGGVHHSLRIPQGRAVPCWFSVCVRVVRVRAHALQRLACETELLGATLHPVRQTRRCLRLHPSSLRRSRQSRRHRRCPHGATKP